MKHERIEAPPEPTGIDLTTLMKREGILRIARRPELGSFGVYMTGDRYGGGMTVGEALENARGRS